MRIIGITGGICSGKSGVSSILKSKKYPVIDCDKITDSLYTYQWFTDGLRHIFGKQIVYNGEVNRGKLGSLVFSSHKDMKKLNKYCMPFILKEVKKQLDEYQKAGKVFVFIDAPILFESGLDKEIEFTDFWVLSVTRDTQRERLHDRKPYLSSKAINDILDNQFRDEERLKHATYIIENNVKNKKILYAKVMCGLDVLKKIESGEIVDHGKKRKD